MQHVTLEQLHKYLEENLTQQEIGRIILETVKEMRHYKQVNKRFFDKLIGKGLQVRIIRVYYGSDRISVSKQVGLDVYSLELKYDNWEVLEEELKTYQLEEYEARIIEKIAAHSQDIATLREIVTFLESKPMKNFDLWRIISAMKGAVVQSIKQPQH